MNDDKSLYQVKMAYLKKFLSIVARMLTMPILKKQPNHYRILMSVFLCHVIDIQG